MLFYLPSGNRVVISFDCLVQTVRIYANPDLVRLLHNHHWIGFSTLAMICCFSSSLSFAFSSSRTGTGTLRLVFCTGLTVMSISMWYFSGSLPDCEQIPVVSHYVCLGQEMCIVLTVCTIFQLAQRKKVAQKKSLPRKKKLAQKKKVGSEKKVGLEK